MNFITLTEKELLELNGGVHGDGNGGTCTDPPGKKKDPYTGLPQN